MRKLEKKTKLQIFAIILVLVILGGYVAWDVHFFGPLTRLFNNREELMEIVNQAGILGPSAYVFLQFLQTIVAPIPGGAVGPIGGFLFGWEGVVWTLVGTTLGALLIFVVAKKFGRGVAEKVLDKKTMEKFDKIPEEKAEMMIFALFLIPGLPDDAIAYIAGMTKVSTLRLAVSWVIGRLPSVIVANMIGMGANEGNLRTVMIGLGIAALGMGFVAIKNKEIMEFLNKHFRDKKLTAGKYRQRKTGRKRKVGIGF